MKTADNVEILPGMTLFQPDLDAVDLKERYIEAVNAYDVTVVASDGYTYRASPSGMYHNPNAAALAVANNISARNDRERARIEQRERATVALMEKYRPQAPAPAPRPTPTAPEVGDDYYSGFASDYTQLPDSCLKIKAIDKLCDDGKTWSILASDNVYYDCIWSHRLKAWVYSLD